ncbi:UNVERIFIED_CONTAM: hypothetical protein HDU68_005689 [Siphonaria sp. JEL0065]|nr:hypothetical protein HDU68_005689 [Siphonaria sp. JEL0065]
MIASTLLTLAAASVAMGQALSCPQPSVVTVRKCNTASSASIQIAQTLGDRSPFVAPSTVSICYTNDAIKLTFANTKEPYYSVNPAYGHNDNIWEQTVAEAFIVNVPSHDVDPQTYLEFEVSPTNQTYSAFIYNPSKVRAAGTPFDHFFVGSQPIDSSNSCKDGRCARFDGITASTVQNRDQKTWTSDVSIPLALFNVQKPSGTLWRANFFRTTYNQSSGVQQYGAWNAPNVISFHQTPCFGSLRFAGSDSR